MSRHPCPFQKRNKDMRIFYITTKLNFNQGGSNIENDLIMRTLQGMGNEVTMVTVFSRFNHIPEPLPYGHIKEELTTARQLGIQWGVFRLLRKYAKSADFFFVDGQTFLYGAGLYRTLGGKVPVFAYFVRELMAWPENVSTLITSKQASIPLWYRTKRKTRFLIERYLCIPFANWIDFFAFGSPQLQKEYEDFGLRAENKSIIIGDPYPWREVMQKSGITEDSYALRNKKSGKVRLFYSNRMAPGKGFDLLVRAFSLVPNKERFTLVLGGAGPEEPLIRQMVSDLNLETHVEFSGWIPKEDYYVALKQADIFIHPRWREAQPSIGLMEAMVFGLPCIVPKGTGLHWVAGKGALPFRFDDAEDLATMIEKLGGDSTLRAKLSENCYLRLKEGDVNYEKTIPAVLEIMKRLRG